MCARKRVFSLFLLTVLVLGLCACESGTNASEKAVSVAERALSITDDYLDGKISYPEADEQLSELKEDMEYVDELDSGAENKAADYSISADLTILSSSVFNDYYENSSETYDKVIESRNNLAEDAGLDKR